MLKRTVPAVVAIAVFIPICYFSGAVPILWPAAMTVLSVVAAYEMMKCVGATHPALLVPGFFVSAAAPLSAHFLPFQLLLILYVFFLIVYFAVDVFSRGKIDYQTSTAAFMGIFYSSASFAALVLLRQFGPYFYLLVFIGPWTSDTFAYLVGRAIGKHKLIPEVSPKKTVEGAVGGVAFAAAAFVLYGWIVSLMGGSLGFGLPVLALMGAVVAAISQIGDLSMSVVKRRYGVKDYGNLFPGHGGVLDRFDSVLLAAPVLWIFGGFFLFVAR